MRRLLVTALLGALASTAMACEKKPGAAADGSGSIAINATSKGFEPSSVKVKKGTPTTLVFTRTSDDTCATEVVFPELSIKKELPKGVAVAIAVPTEKEQTLTFQCGMGMYKSSVVVAAN